MFQIGSLVECVDDANFPRQYMPWAAWPAKGEMYIVRAFNHVCEPIGSAMLLEEIKNPEKLEYNDKGRIIYLEPYFKNNRFRLLQDPMSLDALMEETELVGAYM